MATSPNYGWLEPDNTDLVKNGALAIRTLGNAIDTTMATMVPKSIVDAKGDLIAGTAADTAARLAVGNNGETLVADSSTSTGLRWQGSYPAGKNVLINGLLDIWQRSTSVTFGGEAYNAQDRWANYASASSTFAQETTTVPAGCRFSCKATVGASAAALQSTQVIETLNAAPYAGTTMTLSGYFQSTATPTITLAVFYSNSVDVAIGGSWTSISATSGGSGTAGSSSFTRISGVYAIPSTAKSLKVLWYTGSLASATVLFWGGMQFEAGSLPTTLVRNGATIQGELAACQRYFNRVSVTSGQVGFANGMAQNTTNSFFNFWGVPFRSAPTGTINGALNTICGNSNAAISAINAIYWFANNQATTVTFVSGSLTAGGAVMFYAPSSGVSFDLSAEL